MKHYTIHIQEKLNKINNKHEFINGETYYVMIPFVKIISKKCQDLMWPEIFFSHNNDGYIVNNVKELKENFKRKDYTTLYHILKFKQDKIKNVESISDIVKLCEEKHKLSDICEPVSDNELDNIFN